MVAGVLYVWAFMAQYVLPSPASGTTETLLQYVATYRPYFIVSYALFTVANALSVVGAFGVYALTRAFDRSYAALGSGTLVVGFVAALLSTTAPALIALSYAWSSATDVADQQALAIAAEAVDVTNNPLVAYAFIGVGVIFVSLAILKGAKGAWLGYLGLFVGALNIVRGLPYLVDYSFLTVTFVAVSAVWIFGVGREVYRQA